MQVSLSQFVIMFLFLTVLMKGHVPSSLNRVVNRTACVIPSCTTKYNIQLKKCSNFTVYYLPRPSSCDQAYCFGKYNITFQVFKLGFKDNLNMFLSTSISIFVCVSCLGFGENGMSLAFPSS